MDGGDAASLRLKFDGFHLIGLFKEEEQLAVRGTRCGVKNFHLPREIEQGEHKAAIEQLFLVVDFLLILFPGLAVRRIGNHVAKSLVCEMVLGDGVAQMNTGRVNAFDDEVRFTDGVGLRVDLGTGKLNGVGVDAKAQEILTAFSKHAARAAGGVVEGDNLGKVILNGLEDQVCQQGYSIAGCEVFSRLLVVLFIEAAEEFLEDGAHADIGKSRYPEAIGVEGVFIGKVDAGICDALDNGQKAVVVGQLLGFVVVVKVPEHVADVLTVAVEVFYEVIVEEVVIVGGLGLQAIQRPLAGVEVAEAGDILDCILIQGAQLHLLLLLDFFVHLVLGGFQEGIKTAKDHHRENDVTILATEEYVAKDIIGDVPYEGNHLAVRGFHK